MNKLLFQIPAEINKVTTLKFGAVRLVIDSQENIPAEHRGQLMTMVDKYGLFSFLIPQKDNEIIEPEDIPEFDAKRFDVKKSPAQRIRNRLFVLWKKRYPKAEIDFDSFYIQKIERILEWISKSIEGEEK